MKHIIEFNLPDDKADLELAQDAGALYSALWSIMYDVLRPRIKYNDKLSDEVRKELESIQSECFGVIGGLLDK